jgi:cytochrome P450
VIAKAEESVRVRARAIVDSIASKGTIEFVSEVAAVLPLAIICDMMGVPESDRANLFDLTNRYFAGGDPEYGGTRDTFLEARRELLAYGLWLGRQRLNEPQDDMTSVLVHAQIDGEVMTPEELSSFFVLLIVAGNETTRNAISHGLWALTQFPDQKRVWLENLTGRTPTAVEEIIRWASPIMSMRRRVTRPVTLGGIEMAAGDRVSLWYISINRDEKYFPDPFRFDICRENNHHGAFGTGGPHYCLGAHLARREIAVMFTELLSRLPDIEATAPPAKLRSGIANGIKRLPARFLAR